MKVTFADGLKIENKDKQIIRTILEKWSQPNNDVHVEKIFNTGFSGSHVLVISPKRTLKCVFKIGQREQIVKEYEVYKEKNIGNIYPYALEPNEPPVYLEDGKWAGLVYKLAGEGIYQISSLHEYCLEKARGGNSKAIEQVFDDLLELLGEAWKKSSGGGRIEKPIRLRENYASILPPKLELNVCGCLPETHYVDYENNSFIKCGDILYIEEYVVWKKKFEDKNFAVSLKIEDEWIRVNLKVVDDSKSNLFSENKPFYAVVQQTRRDTLFKQVQELNLGVSYSEDALNIPDLFAVPLPNPLQHLDTILNESLEVTTGLVHGDLNLNNVILVTNNAGNSYLNLIDFAYSRDNDHVLHDLLRLEASLITKILPVFLQDIKGEGLIKLVFELYQELHGVFNTQQASDTSSSFAPDVQSVLDAVKVIRKFATGIEGDRGWVVNNKEIYKEYYHGLFVYLLGALKFEDVSKMGKQLAFWGAVFVLFWLKQLTRLTSEKKIIHPIPNKNQVKVLDILEEIAQSGFASLDEQGDIKKGILTSSVTEDNPLRLDLMMGKWIDTWLDKGRIFLKGGGSWNAEGKPAIFFALQHDGVQVQKAFRRHWYGFRTTYASLLHSSTKVPEFIFEDNTSVYVLKYEPLKGGIPYYLVLALI